MKKFAPMPDYIGTKICYGRYFNLFIGKDNNILAIIPKQFDEDPFNIEESREYLNSLTPLLWNGTTYQDDLSDLIRPLEYQIAFRELPPDKYGWLLSTFPGGNWCHNANGNRKGIIVVGSALRKPQFHGQPVSKVNVMKTYIVNARGMIHPPDKSGGLLYPLTPRYKRRPLPLLWQPNRVIQWT